MDGTAVKKQQAVLINASPCIFSDNLALPVVTQQRENASPTGALDGWPRGQVILGMNSPMTVQSVWQVLEPYAALLNLIPSYLVPSPEVVHTERTLN